MAESASNGKSPPQARGSGRDGLRFVDGTAIGRVRLRTSHVLRVERAQARSLAQCSGTHPHTHLRVHLCSRPRVREGRVVGEQSPNLATHSVGPGGGAGRANVRIGGCADPFGASREERIGSGLRAKTSSPRSVNSREDRRARVEPRPSCVVSCCWCTRYKDGEPERRRTAFP